LVGQYCVKNSNKHTRVYKEQKMKIIVITLAILISMLRIEAVHACDCYSRDFQELAENADQVIVTETLSNPWTLSRSHVKYRFKVIRALRGTKRKKITIFTGKHLCGGSFVVGERYLMIVSKQGNKFVTDQCFYWDADSLYAKRVYETFGK